MFTLCVYLYLRFWLKRQQKLGQIVPVLSDILIFPFYFHIGVIDTAKFHSSIFQIRKQYFREVERFTWRPHSYGIAALHCKLCWPGSKCSASIYYIRDFQLAAPNAHPRHPLTVLKVPRKLWLVGWNLFPSPLVVSYGQCNRDVRGVGATSCGWSFPGCFFSFPGHVGDTFRTY